MENSDEKFFEELAGEKAAADENYEVELTKAPSNVSDKARTEVKTRESYDEPEGQLTVDVYQTPTEIIVESAIAGVKPEDIDVNVTTDSITIRGERQHAKEVKDDDYLYQECYWGRFSRSIILPQEVDPDGADVTLKSGILTVRLPKLNRKKAKKLKVKTDE